MINSLTLYNDLSYLRIDLSESVKNSEIVWSLYINFNPYQNSLEDQWRLDCQTNLAHSPTH